MTQSFPEPRHFDPRRVPDPENPQNLLEGHLGILAVVAAPEAHASGWAAEAAVALAEASHNAGHSAGLLDLALDAPCLHAAAGVVAGEGLSDLVLFGASLARVSQWTASGVRVVTAGTPVGDADEVWGQSAGGDAQNTQDARWVEAARVIADQGCVLAYMVADSAGAEGILSQAQHVILLRHQGEAVLSLKGEPALILEPAPAPVLEAEILPAPASETPLVESTDRLTDLEEVLPTEGPEGVADSGFVEEVILDLDDVAGDSPIDAEAIFAPDPGALAPSLESEPDVEVGGLEVAPEWPAFEQPIEVQEPGSVDPLVASSAETADATTDDLGLDDIIGGDSEFTIVADDLGVPQAFGDVFAERASSMDTGSIGTIEGLIDGAEDTLSRAGEAGLASAEQVSRVDEGISHDEGLHDPSGWGPPPSALDPPVSSPTEGIRRDDPWGEPLAEAPAPKAEVAPTLDEPQPAAAGLPSTDAQSEPLPWEDRRPEERGAVKDTDVPVAEVTRTRARTRGKGPRPFLLFLFLLLVATVALLWWVELLDVPILDGLRGDAP